MNRAEGSWGYVTELAQGCPPERTVGKQGLQVLRLPGPDLLRIICSKSDEHFARAFADRPEHGAAGLLDPEIELQELPEDPWPEIDRDSDIEICSQA